MNKYISLVVILLVLAACVPVEPSMDTMTPLGNFTLTEEPSITLTPSLSPSPTLTFTATENSVNTLTATQYFSTPTAIIGNPTSSGVEIATALGNINGYFIPNRDMNVRACPSMSCNVVDSLAARVGIKFYYSQTQSNGDEWLSLDESGNRWAAYKVGTIIFGDMQ